MVQKKLTKGKVAKSKTAKSKSELVKRQTELEALTTEIGKGEEILGITKDAAGKIVDVKRWYINGICISANCIVGSDEIGKKERDTLELKFKAIKLALRSKSKDLQDEAIDTMLGDLVGGAYQDKLVVYQKVPSGQNRNSLESLKEIQRVRQAADTHLLNIIKAVKDIKHPPVNVVVKEAEQVNVAEQQVNIGKNQANIGTDKQPA